MEENNRANNQVLIIGAGIAGIEASLTLADAGKKVYLVEREPLFGGKLIKFEEVFANMECSTCMAAPKQQEVLQHKNIELLTLCEVTDVQGEAGNFTVNVHKKARYINSVNCIGCNACFEPCPVSLPNTFEEHLGKRKAIYIPCPGALPNMPTIDTEHCLRFKGKDCQLCKDACMFEAIEFEQQDEDLELHVSSIIVATGYDLLDVKQRPDWSYTETGNVYTALEMERLYASNGPTEGKITLRNGKEPGSAAIIHCVGREETGYCSAVCCMYSLKFIHYLKHKLPQIQVYEFYSDLCIPGKRYQEFFEKTKDEGELIRFQTIHVEQQNGKANINYTTLAGGDNSLEVDMVILAPAVVPSAGGAELAKRLRIQQTEKGFFGAESMSHSPVYSGQDGIYLAGCVQGPKDIGESVIQADAAAGKILSEF
jgi:heterodisulfide reductase subunit A